MRTLFLLSALAVGVSATPEPQDSWIGAKEGNWVSFEVESTQNGTTILKYATKTTVVRREKVKVGNREVACVVTETVTDSGGKTTTWYSDEVPGRIVKMVNASTPGYEIRQTCTGFQMEK